VAPAFHRHHAISMLAASRNCTPAAPASQNSGWAGAASIASAPPPAMAMPPSEMALGLTPAPASRSAQRRASRVERVFSGRRAG
jgi:hypothetical protein